MNHKHLKIALIWFGIGLIVTAFLYLEPEYPKNRSGCLLGFHENYYELSAAITIGGALIIGALGLKK